MSTYEEDIETSVLKVLSNNDILCAKWYLMDEYEQGCLRIEIQNVIREQIEIMKINNGWDIV